MSRPVEVVVVGSGLAGLTAAIAAAEAGARVTVLTKSPPGLGNCTMVAAGHFTAAVGGWSSQRHRELTLRVGHGFNQEDLVEMLSQQAPPLLERLGHWGVALAERQGGVHVGRGAVHPLRRGELITRALVGHAHRVGVDFLSRVTVTRVALNGCGVSGVEWFDQANGTHGRQSAGAVILATGGAGRTWRRTDNPPGIRGDGFRLAYELGLSFRDMEFVQFYPLGAFEPGFTTWMIGLEVADRASLTDESGRQLLPPLFAQWGLRNAAEANLLARDKVAVYLSQLYQRGHQVYLHVEELSSRDWTEQVDLQLLARMYPRQRTPGDGPIRVAPLQHYMCGGVVVDAQGQTEIPGLWACGELIGGVDGANRMGGNALTHCLVFGYRAGQQAAASARPGGGEITAGPVRRHDPAGSLPRTMLRAIQTLSEEQLGAVRHGAELTQAAARLDELGHRLGSWQLQGPRCLATSYAAQSAWTVANLVCRAALSRQESRGTHYRTDYPQPDDAVWRKTVVLRRRDARLEVAYLPLGR